VEVGFAVVAEVQVGAVTVGDDHAVFDVDRVGVLFADLPAAQVLAVEHQLPAGLFLGVGQGVVGLILGVGFVVVGHQAGGREAEGQCEGGHGRYNESMHAGTPLSDLGSGRGLSASPTAGPSPTAAFLPCSPVRTRTSLKGLHRSG